MSDVRSVSYACEDCGNTVPCPTCGQHSCLGEECGACGGGCRCYCACPTMRDDDDSDFWS